MVNALVTRDGLTVVFRGGTVPGLGRLDITAEALAYGAVLGLRAMVLIAAGALLAAAVDPDELLRGLRSRSLRAGVTAALATHLIPVLARDGRRLADAQRALNGTPPRLAVLRAVTAGALDRATDVAATLEVRGFGSGVRPPRLPQPVSRHDLAFGASAVALAVLAVVAGVGGWEGFDAYPRTVAPVDGRLVAARRRARRLRAGAVPRPPGDRVSTLALEQVTYAYPDAERPSLRDVTLTVEPGEFVVLAGGSGSGKSTLLRAASGLVPHFHGGDFAGRLVCGGLDTREHGPAELAAVAGTLFQDPETQVVMGSVRSELAFPLENRGWSAAAVARGVEEAALALGIAALLDRSTRELSGGELQRVALGAALAGRPRLLLLDEPTSQLDPVAGDELLGVLRRINEEWGTAVLLAEHRLERCLPAADRVIALRDGALAFDGTPEAFAAWAPPELQPPVTRLCALAGVPERPATVKAARRALFHNQGGSDPPYAADARGRTAAQSQMGVPGPRGV